LKKPPLPANKDNANSSNKKRAESTNNLKIEETKMIDRKFIIMTKEEYLTYKSSQTVLKNMS
jgi:hypothetical protein